MYLHANIEYWCNIQTWDKWPMKIKNFWIYTSRELYVFLYYINIFVICLRSSSKFDDVNIKTWNVRLVSWYLTLPTHELSLLGTKLTLFLHQLFRRSILTQYSSCYIQWFAVQYNSIATEPHYQINGEIIRSRITKLTFLIPRRKTLWIWYLKIKIVHTMCVSLLKLYIIFVSC